MHLSCISLDGGDDIELYYTPILREKNLVSACAAAAAGWFSTVPRRACKIVVGARRLRHAIVWKDASLSYVCTASTWMALGRTYARPPTTLSLY